MMEKALKTYNVMFVISYLLVYKMSEGDENIISFYIDISYDGE